MNIGNTQEKGSPSLKQILRLWSPHHVAGEAKLVIKLQIVLSTTAAIRCAKIIFNASNNVVVKFISNLTIMRALLSQFFSYKFNENY